MRSLLVTLLLVVVALAAWVAWRGSASPREPTAGPASGEPASAEPPALPASAAVAGERASGDRAAPAATRSAPESRFAWSDNTRAVFARARRDPELCIVVAEVIALGPVERRQSGDGQDVTLFVLADSSDGSLRRWRRVHAVLVPAESESRFGCSTPFGELVVGQVRECVLSREWVDLVPLLELGVTFFRSHLLVLAGPEVERPDDPVLARVPRELHVWLGRPACNVFRARVHEVRLGAGDDTGDASAKGIARQFDRLTVDALEVAQASDRLPLPKRVRFAPQPFAAKLALEALEVGREYWFVSDGASLLQVLCAFAPVK